MPFYKTKIAGAVIGAVGFALIAGVLLDWILQGGPIGTGFGTIGGMVTSILFGMWGHKVTVDATMARLGTDLEEARAAARPVIPQRAPRPVLPEEVEAVRDELVDVVTQIAQSAAAAARLLPVLGDRMGGVAQHLQDLDASRQALHRKAMLGEAALGILSGRDAPWLDVNNEPPEPFVPPRHRAERAAEEDLDAGMADQVGRAFPGAA